MEINGLGTRLRKRRHELGFTLDQVAKGVGLKPGTISDLEHGRQKGSTKLYAIAEFLTVRVNWLADGDEPKEPAPKIKETPATYSQHGYHCTPEGARVGAEYDKIEGEERRKIAREFIESLVAAQRRDTRKHASHEASTGPKRGAKKKPPPGHSSRLT